MHFRLDQPYVGFLVLIHAAENAILIVIDTVIIISSKRANTILLGSKS